MANPVAPFFASMNVRRIVLALGCAFLVVLLWLAAQQFMTKQNGAVAQGGDTSCAEWIAETGDPYELFLIGEHYFGGGAYNLSCARRAYERALRIDSHANETLWYQFGRIDFLEGKFSDAIFKFNKQIEYFDDAAANVYYMLGLTYGYRARQTDEENDWAKAEEGFRTFITYDSTAPWPRVDLAWVLFSQGKYEEMKPILEPSLTLYPDNPWVLNMYGLALLNTGERKAAHEHFLRALEEAEKVTVEEWGRSYPGNDPGSWEKGLAEMRDAIRHNIQISAQNP